MEPWVERSYVSLASLELGRFTRAPTAISAFHADRDFAALLRGRVR